MGFGPVSPFLQALKELPAGVGDQQRPGQMDGQPFGLVSGRGQGSGQATVFEADDDILCRHGPDMEPAAGQGGQARPAGTVVIGFAYGRLPALLAAPGDKPEGLPVHLAGPLLVAYACRELFERLEEGADGAKTQTAAYGKRYEVLLAELAATTGPRQTAPADVPSAADPYGFGEDWP